MSNNIINDNWNPLNKDIFSCAKNWEVKSLVTQIQSVYPFYSVNEIKKAIESACQKIKIPHPREEFTKKVIEILGCNES